MKLKTLYEDKAILAIDKPVGILVDEVLEKFPGCFLAHRLDKETSGVLLLAKNEKAHEFLQKQFKARTIKKIYIAVVQGSVKNDRGVVNKPIGRSPRDFRRYSAGRGARGEMREAETFWKVLKRIKDFTILEVRPKTGRTHQIRVHMKYLNHPVAGDALYNPRLPAPEAAGNGGQAKDKKWPRMMLHALSIEFKNLKGEVVKIESPLPKEFEKLI